MARLSGWYGRLLDGLMLVACLLLLGMAVMIGADVVSRNIGAGGVAVSNELSEDILYLMTLLAAPWLLRQGQHIRVDIILRALPTRVAWAAGMGRRHRRLCSAASISSGTGPLVTVASYSAGSIIIKTLVTPEWWTLAPLPVGFAPARHRIHLPHAPACRGRDRPARRRGFGGVKPVSAPEGPTRGMSWQMASLLLLGGSTVLLFVGMPVAISFIAINVIGAILFLGGDAGLHQVARNSVAAAHQFLADADPAVHPDGRGAVPHRPRAEGDRRRRAADQPGAGPARRGRGRRRNGFLRDLGLDDCNDGDARFADAAGDAVARLQSGAGDRPDHGDRRGRHADPAVRAHRPARQPFGNFDLQAPDRRRRAGPDPERRLCRLHRRSGA